MSSSGSGEASVPGVIEVTHGDRLGVHVFAERAQCCVLANGSEIGSRDWPRPAWGIKHTHTQSKVSS